MEGSFKRGTAVQLTLLWQPLFVFWGDVVVIISEQANCHTPLEQIESKLVVSCELEGVLTTESPQ